MSNIRIGNKFYNTKLNLKGICKGNPSPRGIFRAEMEDGTVRYNALAHCTRREPTAATDEEKLQKKLDAVRVELARERQRRIEAEYEHEADLVGGRTFRRPHEPHAEEIAEIESRKAAARQANIAAGNVGAEFVAECLGKEQA